MKFVCFLPCTEIDWNATGAMLSGITGVVAVIVTIFIAIRQGRTNKILSNQQKILTNNQIKVEIFERRLKFYETFCDFYDFSENWIFNQKEKEKINDGLKSISHNLGYKIETAKNGTKDMFHNIHRGHELKQIINKGKFIFENRKIDEIEKYIELFTYELYEFCRFESYTENYERVKSIHQNLKQMKIKDLIESELTLDNTWNK